MKNIRKLWGCGHSCRGMVVGLMAAPIVASGALLAPVLLVLGAIAPPMYQRVGQAFIYGALAFVVFAALCFASAVHRGELRNW